MDTTLSTGSGLPTPSKSEFKKKIFVWVSIIFLVLLIAVLIILNYFTAFPFLSFLPHKVSPTQQVTKHWVQPYNYDKSKPKAFFQKYLQENIPSAYLPPSYSLQQEITTTRNTGTYNRFTLAWTIEKANVQAQMAYDFNALTNTPNNAFGYLLVPNTSNETKITESYAQKVLSTYTKFPFSHLTCTTQQNLTSCGIFKSTSSGKQGYAVTIVTKPPQKNTPGKNYAAIYTCYFFPGGNTYNKAKSCADIGN